MKKILLGFIAIGLLTFVGCKKDDDAVTETSSDDGSTDTSDDTTETSSDDGSTDSDSGDGATDDSSIKYGEGATDIDGNTYKSVIIGEQEWMSENLRTTKHNDGTTIPNVTDNTEWSTFYTAAWCHYDNDNQYDTIYGKLYNWYAVETGKLCPTGWHVPTNAEWDVLTDFLTANGHNGTEGNALKATLGWYNNENGADDYGWNGLSGGSRDYGYFNYLGYFGSWWSSSESGRSYAEKFELFYGNDIFDDYPPDNKGKGNSVRCLKD